MQINTGIQVFSEVEGKILNYLNETGIKYAYDQKRYMISCSQTYENGDENGDFCADVIIILFNDPNIYLEVCRTKNFDKTNESSANIHDIYTDLYNLFTQQTSNP